MSASLYAQCPLCGSEILADRYRTNGFTITRCNACTLVFVRERMTNETLAPYYAATESDYIYDDPANALNLSYYDQRLREIIVQHVPGGRILDVGCSRGLFLDVMGDNWERHGIELVSHYADLARKNYGAHVHQGTIDDYPAPAEPFDVVTLLDTLDHCIDPSAVLRRANQLMRKDGLVVVKVHNIACLWAKLAGRRFYAVIPPYHLFYFNRATLSQALDAAGFEMTSVKFIAHRLALKTIPYRFAQANPKSLFYKFYSLLDKTPIGNIPVYKNLFDLITVTGKKVRDL